jgi:Mlc titration factor MtfA (ptsG expression regulator)
VFPKEWLAILQRNMPLYNKLPDADQAELRRHILVFLAEKRFEGCGGLEITDEMRVTIAAQACVLLLRRKTDYYPGLRTILVYPRAYVARHSERLPSGIMVDGRDVRLGESWRRGSVVLSWDDVRRSAADIHDGHNVVFHEFAHQIDMSGGRGDSSEVLKRRSSYIAWARVLKKDYEKLRRAASSGHRSLLDKYGASNPAEFFAVATEVFFERPKELQNLHPELYAELQRFYQQDPGHFA